MNVPPGVCVLRSDALEAWVIPFGARLMQLWWRQAPEASRQGQRPLTLGFADPWAYAQDRMALGAVCGRYANRLADARLTREGQVWDLDVNHPLGHCIHGGQGGLGVLDWQVTQHDEHAITLRCTTPDGHMGFPGACVAQVRYALAGDALHWEATAEVDAPCPINLVQHSYWNLAAHADLRSHRLQVHALHHHPIDARELPLPAEPVSGSHMDFRQSRAIQPDEVAKLEGALVLEGTPGEMREVATLSVPDLSLHLHTDQPLLHLYAAAGLRPSAAALGVAHQAGAGLCLETEQMPNGPALGADVWVMPGEVYRHRMVWRFAGSRAD